MDVRPGPARSAGQPGDSARLGSTTTAPTSRSISSGTPTPAAQTADASRGASTTRFRRARGGTLCARQPERSRCTFSTPPLRAGDARGRDRAPDARLSRGTPPACGGVRLTAMAEPAAPAPVGRSEIAIAQGRVLSVNVGRPRVFEFNGRAVQRDLEVARRRSGCGPGRGI
jgi:hypothetical protein